MKKHTNNTPTHRPATIDPSVTRTIMTKVPQKDRGNTLALYLFYYYHAMLQGTNHVYCDNDIVAGKDKWGNKTGSGLGWNDVKITRIRKHLKHVDLIRPKRDRLADGRWGAEYIELVYYRTKNHAEEMTTRGTGNE